MSHKEIRPELIKRLDKLEQKYEAMGQDMLSYLDGLLYSRYLTYWDYLELDTLLSLQKPRTEFPDEEIFIVYHQVTELYFKLILLELEHLCKPEVAPLPEWRRRVERMVSYYRILVQSFEVMAEGMDRKEFLKFRMALLPASGFQSVQFRSIELMCTDLLLLVSAPVRGVYDDESPLSEMFEHIYWKYGNIELKSGKKTLTLRMFEEKYNQDLLELAAHHRSRNLRRQFMRLPEADQQDEHLRSLMRELDLQANVFWPLSHYKSAVRYLNRDEEVIAATGGTNWQKYLPPKFQRVQFFPQLWSEQDQKEWGKSWVLQVFKEQIEDNWRKVTPEIIAAPTKEEAKA
ncbi:MAG: tryptophan 2,3-dioxygenase family protein [Bacteroidota bacterium]